MRDYLLTIYKPAKSFERLLSKQNFFALGFMYVAIPIACYTMMYVFLTMAHGAPSVFKPWLNIPSESYYAANRFLLTPGMLLAWLAATSVTQISSRFLKGEGTFEQTLSVLGLAISIAMWGGLIHDLPMSFLSALGVIDARQHEIAMNSPTIFRTLLWIAYGIYFIAFVVLFPTAVRVVQKLTVKQSVIIGLIGFAVFQTIFFLFNR